MLTLDASKSEAATTDILRAVQTGFFDSHALAVIVALVMVWFFVSNTVVYNYSFSLLLFFDIFLVKRAFPALFEQVRSSHPALLYGSGIVGACASVFGAYVTFRSPWTPLFSVSDWRLWLAILVAVSALAAVAIYAISQFT